MKKPRPNRARRSFFRPALESLESRDCPATLHVDWGLDSVSHPGHVTLRDAVAAAINHTTTALGDTGTGNDTIVFGPNSTPVLSLTDPDTTFGPSALVIHDKSSGIHTAITIDGGAAGQAIDVFAAERIFAIEPGNSLMLNNVTLFGGNVQGSSGGAGGGGGGGSAGLGGAIYNSHGTLTIIGTTVFGNSATGGNGGDSGYLVGGGGGGGLLGSGGNGSQNGKLAGIGGAAGLGGGGSGGGLKGSVGGFASGGGGGAGLVNSTGGTGGFGGGGGGGVVAGGQAGYGGGNGGTISVGGFGAFGGSGGGGAGLGGAIYNDGGTVVVTNTIFINNGATGGQAGGIGNHGNAKNGQGQGGAIFSRNGSLTLLNDTITAGVAGLTADAGRGVFVLADGAPATVKITNTIIGQTDNATSDLVTATRAGGSIVAGGTNNLVRNNASSGIGILSSADPLLLQQDLAPSFGPGSGPQGAPKFSLGGLSSVYGLLSGSPAIDAGTAAGAPAVDRRGISRPQGGGIDIGAIEIRANARVMTLASYLGPDAGDGTDGGDALTPINTAFSLPFKVHVVNPDTGVPISGVTVTYALISSNPQTPGASATFQTTTTPTTDANGDASVSLTANGVGGTYELDVSAPGLQTVRFTPGNLSPTVLTHTTSSTHATITVPLDLPPVATFQTRVIGKLSNGTTLVFDITTNHAPGSAEVNALIAQAQAALTAAHGKNITSPVLTSLSQPTSSVSVGTVSFGTATSITNLITIGPGTVLFGDDQSQFQFVPAGASNINTNTHIESFFANQSQPTVTYTSTYVISATAPTIGRRRTP